MSTDPTVCNALSIDVEDYHSIVSRWWFGRDALPTPAVVENTEAVLDILSEFNARATFFVLGEVAQRYPGLVRRIAEGGHELGVHGYKHLWVNTLTAQEFRAEVERGKGVIEDAIGRAVVGHRAPAFSINLKMAWAFETLADLGLRYDSSVYPIKGKRYGDPSAGLDPFEVKTAKGTILEIPPATLEFCGRRWPVCGGGYLRHFPYWVNRWALRRINRRRSGVVYLHPYELEVSPPARAGDRWPAGKRLRYLTFSTLQYRNRGGMRNKLRRLLADFRFDALVEAYGRMWVNDGCAKD